MITALSVTGDGVTGDKESALTPEQPQGPRKRWQDAGFRRNVLLGAVVVWAAVITVVVFGRGDGTSTPVAAKPSPSPSPSNAPLSVAEVYRTLLPSVVLIQTAGGGGSIAGAQSAAESALGTGVVANADGTILTARHVIDGARSITVTYSDGTTTPAAVASEDAARDVATISPAKLPETLVPATLGGGPAVGDDVVAIGNPLGLTATTTSGVVSGLNRVSHRQGSTEVTGLIQFDAAVNPGSSGGPLVNDRGQVIGIVVSLANPTSAGTFIGIGFAVPIGAALGAGRGDGRAPPL